ncbi:MAG: DUF4136 domain-containing protein [Chlorobi bacterium]|nr:DUF4136 domain-containing protein [Chlorobiota bacterium]
MRFTRLPIKLFLILLLISGIAMLYSCSSSLNVVADYNGDLDFSQYTTYNFLRPHPDSLKKDRAMNPAIINQLNQRRQEAAIDDEMYIRGIPYRKHLTF